jgi:hypothetical protein
LKATWNKKARKAEKLLLTKPKFVSSGVLSIHQELALFEIWARVHCKTEVQSVLNKRLSEHSLEAKYLAKLRRQTNEMTPRAHGFVTNLWVLTCNKCKGWSQDIRDSIYHRTMCSEATSEDKLQALRTMTLFDSVKVMRGRTCWTDIIVLEMLNKDLLAEFEKQASWIMARDTWKITEDREAKYFEQIVKQSPAIGKAVVDEIFRPIIRTATAISNNVFIKNKNKNSFYRHIFRQARAKTNIEAMIQEQVFKTMDPWASILHTSERQREE